MQSRPLLRRTAFLDLLAACANPIGLIPLDESTFIRCKSPINFFDCAAAGVPALCSRMSPYVEEVDDGRTERMVEKDPRLWQAALLELVHLAAYQVAMAHRLFNAGERALARLRDLNRSRIRRRRKSQCKTP